MNSHRRFSFVHARGVWFRVLVFFAFGFGFFALPALASPMIVGVGAAQARLELTPDPPQTGRISAIVSLSGVSADKLAATNLSFSSAMPTMAMSGPSGSPVLIGPGKWTFRFSSAMATTWAVSLHFSGGVEGSATFRFAIGGADSPGASTSAMSGMSGSSGNPEAWRWSALALGVVLIAVVVVVFLRKDRRPLTIATVVGAVIVILGFAALQAKYAAPAMDMATMANIPGSAALPVTLAPVQSSETNDEIHAPGTVSAFLTQDIVTRAPGILTNFTVYAGDRVSRGQVLATLDAPDLQSRAIAAAADARAQAATADAAAIEAHHHAPNAVIIARAGTSAMQSDLSAAQADRTAKDEQARYWQSELAREKTLLDEGAVSVQEFQDERAQAANAQSAASTAADRVVSLRQQIAAAQTKTSDAVASVDQMEAQAVAAREQASRSAAQAATEATYANFRTVTSPSDAIVVKRMVDPGVYVQPGTVIARIAVVKQLRIAANVAQESLGALRVGLPLEARLQDGRVVHGRISSIAPIADPTTHTASIEAVVENPDSKLVAGGFVEVLIHARVARAGLHVPSVAIIGSGSEAAVWTDVNGTAHRIPVRIAADDGTTATVTGDLLRNARVVVDGAATLQEGQAIAEARS